MGASVKQPVKVPACLFISCKEDSPANALPLTLECSFLKGKRMPVVYVTTVTLESC